MAAEPGSESFVERRKFPRQQVYEVALCHLPGKELQCIIKNFSREGVLFAPTDASSGLPEELKAGTAIRLTFEHNLQKYDLECSILRVLEVEGAPVYAGKVSGGA